MALLATPKVYADPQYQLQSLRPEYQGEEKGQSLALGDSEVIYLDPEARTQYELIFKNGLVYNFNNKIFDTGTGHAIFVMTADGRIYASKVHTSGGFHHSSLTAGGPVAAAGEIVVKNGKIVKINNLSGHYLPSPILLQQIIAKLNSLGHFPEVEIVGSVAEDALLSDKLSQEVLNLSCKKMLTN